MDVKRTLPVYLVMLLWGCSQGGEGVHGTPELRASAEPSDVEPAHVAKRPAEQVTPPSEAARAHQEAAPTTGGSVPREEPDNVAAPESPAGEEALSPAPGESPQPDEPRIVKRVVLAQDQGLGVQIREGADSMKLLSLAVGIAVEERTPVGVADRFTVIPPRFHCHCVVDSRAPESTIIHTWRRGTRIISQVELQVGKSPAWRTWSRQRIRPEWADQWSCTVTTVSGHVLGAAVFEVSPELKDPSVP